MQRIVARLNRTFGELSEAWQQFWFSEEDPTVLCIMRILVGGMCTYTVFVWGLQFDALLGDNAWNSPELLAEIQADGFAPSFWWYVPESARMVVHFCCLATLLCFTIGLCTRVTSVLSMAILISYSYRAHLANYGLDQINAILTFYLCIAPCNARFSVDRLIWRRTVRPSVSANLATRLIQFHFCVIYSFAGLAKLQGEGWWNGEAIWMALANREYQTIDMTWIAWFPWVSDLATHITILFELSFWVLIWGRFRPLVLAVAAALHLGIGAMMGMWTFAFIMIFGHLSFWSPKLVNRLLNRTPFGSDETVIAEAAKAPSVTPDSPLTIPAQPSTHDEPTEAAERPRVICIDASPTGRSRCATYFTSRDYECYTTPHIGEATQLCRSLNPVAVILVGDQLPDTDLLAFETHDTDAFYILGPQQIEELSDRLTDSGSHILPDTNSLGDIRRAMERLIVPTQVATATVPQSDLPATDFDQDEEEGSCQQIPNKPR